jgi:hypothetical protein
MALVLNLSHQHRINIINLLGAQRGTLADLRAFWELQDRLALNAEEKKAIEYRVTVDRGIEVPSWNPDLILAAGSVDVTISEAEGQRLRKVVEEWPHFLNAVDRVWLESLMNQLPDAVPVPLQGQGVRM